MRVTIPTYVESRMTSDGAVHCVRPLFSPRLERRSELVERALDRLRDDLQRFLNDLGRKPRHDSLAASTFYPPLDDAVVMVTVELRRRIARLRFLVVTFSSLGRRIAFTPSIPGFWFEVPADPTWKSHAAEHLEEHLRRLAKEHEEKDWEPESLGFEKRAWITELDIEISSSQRIREDDAIALAALEDDSVGSGNQELHRVGRCLDALYPDELERAVLRDDVVGELDELLRAPDRRPVLVVGPQKVGKTTIVHECVFRRARRRGRRGSRGNTWLLAPQRLISGMSYVGQWEKRVMVIVEEAGKRDHILYFDDLLGLFHTGQSAESDFNVAHLLKHAVLRHRFRMLAEITPQAFRILRERDRGFADLFHIVPVSEPTESGTRRMLFHVIRRLEDHNRCRFHLDVLPQVMDLCRRFVRDLAFPGKASAILRQLAVKYRGGDVNRVHALADFRAKSGLATEFLDGGVGVRRSEIVRALQGKPPDHSPASVPERPTLIRRQEQAVTGQEEALEAVADAICIARARLHDPERPLGSFLFLGPTGVGKTHCAKSIAGYLFGSPARLLRFDMNQYVSPYAVAELVGTFHEPQGLLTTAIRRQPFAVVLFDEIEKAHPDVLDVLLQVLGEGRLTDALGRTVSFANTIVILTSNLGTREAGSRLGFHDLNRDDSEVYRHAAEEFFRPEFFNRLDRIVPFHRLRREHIQSIASQLIEQVFSREGLQRRRVILDIDPAALERIIDAGYHPELGARALKRSIERLMTRTVARQLAAVNLDAAAVIRVGPAPDGIRVDVESLQPAEPAEDVCLDPTRDVGSPEETVPKITGLFERMLAEERDRLGVTSFSAGEPRPEEEIYLGFREEVEELREMIRDISERIKLRQDLDEAKRLSRMLTPTQSRLAKRHLLNPRQAWKEAFATEDIYDFWRRVERNSVPYGHEDDAAFLALLRRTARLCLSNQPRARVLFCMRRVGPIQTAHLAYLLRDYREAFSRGWAAQATEVELPETSATPHDIGLLVVEGPGVDVLARIEEGTQLYLRSESSAALQVLVFPLGENEDPVAVYLRERKRRDDWIQERQKGGTSYGGADSSRDPWSLQRVLRIWGDGFKVLDFRTGLTGTYTSNRLLMDVLIPLPPEIITPKSRNAGDFADA